MTFLFKKVLEKYTSFSADEGTNRDNFSVLSCLEDFVLQVCTQRPKKKKKVTMMYKQPFSFSTLVSFCCHYGEL